MGKKQKKWSNLGNASKQRLKQNGWVGIQESFKHWDLIAFIAYCSNVDFKVILNWLI